MWERGGMADSPDGQPCRAPGAHSPEEMAYWTASTPLCGGAQLCGVWGSWLCHCHLSQALDKVHSRQTLEEAEPCRNLAWERLEGWAVEKTQVLWGAGEWAKAEIGRENPFFFSVPPAPSIHKILHLAGWQMRIIYKFPSIIIEQAKRMNFELKGNPLITQTGRTQPTLCCQGETLHLPRLFVIQTSFKEVGTESSQCAALKRCSNMRCSWRIVPNSACWTKHSERISPHNSSIK